MKAKELLLDCAPVVADWNSVKAFALRDTKVQQGFRVQGSGKWNGLWTGYSWF